MPASGLELAALFLSLYALHVATCERASRRDHALWAAIAAIGLGSLNLAAERIWLSAKLVPVTFYSTRWLLERFYPNVVSDPSHWVLGTGAFQGVIAAECAGYRGVSVVIGTTLVYLWTRREALRFPRAFLLLPLAGALSLLLNCLRLVALTALATSYSETLAVTAFHPNAGWICAALVTVAVVALGETVLVVAPSEGMNPATPWLAPFATLLFASLLSTAFSIGYDYLYPMRIGLVAAVLWHYRRRYGELLGAPTPSAVALGVVAYAAWAALLWHANGGQVAPWVAMSPRLALLWTVGRVLGSVVVVPLAEELAFRGYALRVLQSSDFEAVPIGRLRPLAVLVSSLAFGLLHSHWLAGFLAGLIFAVATGLRGRLGDALTAHAVANLLLFLDALLLKRWWLLA